MFFPTFSQEVFSKKYLEQISRIFHAIQVILLIRPA
jgi:hypothetical protein